MKKIFNMLNKTEVVCAIVIGLIFLSLVLIRSCIPGAEVFDGGKQFKLEDNNES